jgi:hypothetical protein
MLAIVSRYVGSIVLTITDDFFHNGPPMLMCQSIFYSQSIHECRVLSDDGKHAACLITCFPSGPEVFTGMFYSAHLTPKSPCSRVRKLVMEETLYPSAALSVNLNSTRINMDANSYKLHASGYYDVLLLGSKLPIMVSTVLASRDHQVF